MKAAAILPSCAVAALLAGLALSVPNASAAPGDPACETTSSLLLKASQLEAQAQFLKKVALIVNDPKCDPAACVKRARAERQADLDLADEQFAARQKICAFVGDGPYAPDIAPDEFLPNITNQWMPMVPGRTLVYETRTPDGLERDECRTLDDVEIINGFLVRKVRDIVTLDGEHSESTQDFYSQHENGDVWYFGEVSGTFEDGFLDSLEGSWRTGKDGAKPGIIMLATPTLGAAYRQEYLPGVAEDVGRVISLDETVTVPYGTFEHCLETEESAGLEPGDVEHKYYASGIGVVLDIDLASGERTELVDVID